MSPNDSLRNLRNVGAFCSEILEGFSENKSNTDLQKTVESRLNKKLHTYSPQENPIANSNIEELIESETKKLVNKEHFYSLVYSRVTKGYFNFLIKKDGYYIFDLSIFFRSSYTMGFYPNLEELIRIIFGYDLIQITNDINYIQYLKTYTVAKSSLQHLQDKIKIYSLDIKKNRFVICLSILIIGIFLFFLFNNRLIEVSSDTQKDIALAIIGAEISILGFAVVFFQLSFDNLKKNYGAYARVIIFNLIGKGIVITFLISLVSSFFVSLFSIDDYVIRFLFILKIPYNMIHNISFNISLILFLVFIYQIYERAIYMFKYSLSFRYNGLIEIIKSVQVEHLAQVRINSLSEYKSEIVSSIYEENPIEIINDIYTNAVQTNNYRLIKNIIFDLSGHLQTVINDQAFNEESKIVLNDVVFSYTEIISKFIGSPYTHNSQSKKIIDDCLISIEEINKDVVVHGSKVETFISLADFLLDIFNISIDGKDVDEVEKVFSFYSNCVTSHVMYNLPQGYDLDSQSIQVHRERGGNFAKNQQLYSIILTYCTGKFHEIITTIFEKFPDNVDLQIKSVEIFSSFFYNIIFNKVDNVYMRYHFINNVLSIMMAMYLRVINKICHTDNRKFKLISPFSIQIIVGMINSGYKDYGYFLSKYNQYGTLILKQEKGLDYVTLYAQEAIYFFKAMTKILQEKIVEDTFDKYDAAYMDMNRVIGVFHSHDFSPDKIDKDAALAIYSIFVHYKNENSDKKIPDDEFYTKYDEVLGKVKWAATLESGGTMTRMYPPIF